MRLCGSLILTVHALAFQTPLGSPGGALSGVIEGSVIDSVTREPIRKAIVTLVPIPIVMGIRPSGGMLGGDLYDPTQMPAHRIANAPPAIVTTDAGGQFRAVLTPGRYDVRAERSGYLSTPAGVAALSLIPGETLKDVTIKLTQHAVITGRVVDADGEPLAQVRVQCLRWTTMGPNGQRTLIPQSSSGTNDQGEYRIFGIVPGHYIVSAEAGVVGVEYVTLFAPGVTGLAAAQEIDLAPGTTRAGIDFRMRRFPVVEVSGKVTGAEGLVGTAVSLLPRNPALLMSSTRQHSAPVNPDGTFVLRNVPPGSYILHTAVFRTGGIPSQNQQRLTGRMNLDVAGRDLSGLTLALKPGVNLKGQIHAEDEPPLDSVNLWFQPQDGGGFSGGANSRVDREGRFAVSSLDPLIYRIQTGGLPKGYYVKSVQMGGVPAPEAATPGALDLSGLIGEVIVTLERGTAEVSGKVLDQKQRPASDVQVMVVNAQGEIVRSTTSLIDGQYRIAELPPGTYRFFPVVDADISDPQTLDRLSAAAPKISLAKSARETLNLEVQ